MAVVTINQWWRSLRIRTCKTNRGPNYSQMDCRLSLWVRRARCGRGSGAVQCAGCALWPLWPAAVILCRCVGRHRRRLTLPAVERPALLQKSLQPLKCKSGSPCGVGKPALNPLLLRSLGDGLNSLLARWTSKTTGRSAKSGMAAEKFADLVNLIKTFIENLCSGCCDMNVSRSIFACFVNLKTTNPH